MTEVSKLCCIYISTEFIQFSLANNSLWIMNCGLFFDQTFRDSKSSKLRPYGVGMDRAQLIWLPLSPGNGNYRVKNRFCAYVSAIQFNHWFSFVMMIRRNFFVCHRQHFLHYFCSWVWRKIHSGLYVFFTQELWWHGLSNFIIAC